MTTQNNIIKTLVPVNANNIIVAAKKEVNTNATECASLLQTLKAKENISVELITKGIKRILTGRTG